MTRGAVCPLVESERLTLRGHRIDDFDDCFAMWSDANVTHFIGGRPSTREETWGRLLRYIGHWQAMGYGYWIVEERSSGRFVGEVGFADMKREITPSLDGMPEIGWALVPAAQGQGLASEAVKAALAWGDANFGGRKTACMIDPDNAPSIRVAEKCGYREFARTTYRGLPSILFQR